ncbi:GntR family transcriptional regulator [Pacificibacter marinus]|uniref:GntR family transcriptional regulator n=1 Tax=Pacificibacter marinus TaxID=658057 RepID=UPI001C07E1DB|nr:GntR family transcriptional regulator [Pacificibacter marinus]
MNEPLYTRILHALVSEVAEGILAPGDRLMENRIATRFGVSRAPARQALTELEALGLVTHATAPARGFLVAVDALWRANAQATPPSAPFTTQTIPTWQRIYGEIEDALTQRIAFGTWRLIEMGIARHFDVSRTVAREVLARLQARGLVVNEGKGWIAPKLSETRVRELYELRALLEPAALKDLSNRLPTQLLERMIADLQNALNTDVDWQKLDQLEADLHVTLLNRCKNSALRKSMTEAQSLLLAHKFFYQHTNDIYPVEPFLDEHLIVLTALHSGAVADACDGLRQHLLSSSDRTTTRIARLQDSFHDTPPTYLEPIGLPV